MLLAYRIIMRVTLKNAIISTRANLFATEFMSFLNNVLKKVNLRIYHLDSTMMNIGKFSRFCHDFECKLPNRKITEIFNQVVHKAMANCNFSF